MRISSEKKIKALWDVVLNITASALPIVVLQLIVFPRIALENNESMYGLMITVYSLFNIIPAAIGTTLNNMRLLYDLDYKKLAYEGDFNILALIGSLINVIGVAVSLILLENDITISFLFILIIISLMILLHDYFITEFRIKLNFKLILLDNFILSLGYLIGLLILDFTQNWIFIFLIGHFLSLIFSVVNTDIWKEKRTRTPLFSFITKESLLLLISTFLLRMTGYADKLLLYPILGGAAVSTYYAATILSKIVALAITPINSVILSYLSKVTKKPNELFWKIFLFGIGVGLIGYVFSIFMSELLLELLYPQFAENALKFIPITSAITITNVLASILQPFVLKYSNMKYQILINLTDTICYILLSLLFLNYWGLLGFCIGVLISRILKVFLLLLVFMKSEKEVVIQ